MRIETDTKLDFNDVLLKPKRSTISSRLEVQLTRKFTFKTPVPSNENASITWEGIPIISANMTSVTTAKVWHVMHDRSMLAALPKHIDERFLENISFYSGYENSTIPTFGIRGNVIEEIEKVLTILPLIKFIILDVANGYMERFVNIVNEVKQKFPFLVIIAGNVVTGEMTEALCLAGASIIKIGIGSGSACTTRLMTGVGYPQLSAVMECADAAHGLGKHVMSDGGCVTTADIVKGYGAGADFVMLGGMLGGHNENGSEFFGMSSEAANIRYAGGLKDYKASEGRELDLPERGPISKTLQEIEGGIRSACSYLGAKKIKDIPKSTTFIRVNNLVNTSLANYTK